MIRFGFAVLVCASGCAEVVGARFDEARPYSPANIDAGVDASVDAPVDAPVDATMDAPVDAPDAPDATTDPDEHVWSIRFGDGAIQNGIAVALTPDDQLVAVGSFQGTIQIPGQPALTSIGGEDIFVLVLDPAGIVLNARSFGSIGTDTANAVAVTPDGDIVLVGTYGGDIPFGTKVLTHKGGWDAFVAELSPDGDPLWSVGFGDEHPQFAYAVAVAPSGQIAVAGGFRGDMQLDANTALSAPAVIENAYIALFHEDGSLDWAKSYGAADLQVASGLKFRGDDLLVSGTFRNVIDFGDGKSLLSYLGASFVAAVDRTTGKAGWAYSPGEANLYGLRDVVGVLSSGDVVAAVGLAEIVKLGGNSSVTPDRVDLFVSRLAGTSGSPLWSHEYGDTPNLQEPSAVAVGGNDRIAVVGHFKGTLNFGQGPLVSLGERDGFLARFTGEGVPYSSRAMSGSADQTVSSVVMDSKGRAYVIGSSQGTADWGGAALLSAGGYDVVIAAYDP